MQLETRFVECVRQDSEYFLYNQHEVRPEELITKLRILSHGENEISEYKHKTQIEHVQDSKSLRNQPESS